MGTLPHRGITECKLSVPRRRHGQKRWPAARRILVYRCWVQTAPDSLNPRATSGVAQQTRSRREETYGTAWKPPNAPPPVSID